MKRRSVALAGPVAILLALSPLAGAHGVELRPGVHTYFGIYASLPTDDLEPFREVVGDALAVALGESIHTSGGYSRLKYRLFRYLVEEMGFRAFAFESPWERAESVAEYVATCAGTPEEALRGLFGVWQNESVRDIAKWMCVWNHRHPDDRVVFLGFDEQQPDLDYAALRAHLKRFGLPDSDPRIQGLESCSKDLTDLGIRTSPFNECIKRLDQLARYLDRREANLIRRTSAEEVEWARLRIVGLRAWQEQKYYRPRDPLLSFAARDAAMAHIFLKRWELQYPDLKMVIWAHNLHINRLEKSYDAKAMGDHLAAALAEDYVPIGLIGYSVEVDWPNIELCGELPRPSDDSHVEVKLHDLGAPYLFVDLDFPGTGDPFLENGRKYNVGGQLVVPREHYDALFFLDHSPKMIPVHRPPCQ